ncbi:MAG: 50S ribosomal protein L25 [bacterium]|nr:50S ribosomal protein L25 [bacterium]
MAERKEIVITVESRDETGKEAATRLRHTGRIPAVVYGGDKAPLSISVDNETIRNLLKSKAGENTLFLLKLKGTKQEREAMIKEIQTDPLTREFLHIDFIRVTRGQTLNVMMPIVLTGDCVGIRNGGIVDFSTRELSLEILPKDMIDNITVDISELDIGHLVTVADLESMLPESGKFLDDPKRVVAKVEIPRAALAEEEAEEEEGIEGEEDLETSEQAEPEVIHGKGKDEAAGDD